MTFATLDVSIFSMAKLGPRSEFFYVAEDHGHWSVTGASIPMGHPVEGDDLKTIRKQLRKEIGRSFVLLPGALQEAPKIS